MIDSLDVRKTDRSPVNILKRMVRLLRGMLIEPRSSGEDDRRREYILNVLLLGSIGALTVLDAFVLYYSLREGGNYPGVPFALFSAIPAFFIVLHWLSRRGYFSAASYLIVAAYFASTSYAAYHWGVNVPTVILGYALVILIASILINTQFGFITAATVALFIIPIWRGQVYGTIAIRKPLPSTSDAIVFAALYFLIMVVAWLSNREIERSLRRARSSETNLKRERDMLEVTVQERTRELGKVQFEKIEQVYRFAEFGQLATGLFHDLLNVLNAKVLQAEERATQNPEHKNEAVESTDGAIAASRQIERFMQAIRKQMDHRTSYGNFLVAAEVQQVIQLVSYRSMKEHVRVELKDETDQGLVYFGDSFKFQQVVLNLTLNAIDSYQGTSRDAKDRNVTIRLTSKIDGLAITVEDRGSGMPPELLAKIFDPFFSTKPTSSGTGIGLASVKKIVEEDFVRTISVLSEPGRGSIFMVALPAQEPKAIEANDTFQRHAKQGAIVKNLQHDQKRDSPYQRKSKT